MLLWLSLNMSSNMVSLLRSRCRENFCTESRSKSRVKKHELLPNLPLSIRRPPRMHRHRRRPGRSLGQCAEHPLLGMFYDEYGLGGAGGRMTPLSWLLAAFTLIGAFNFYRWCWHQFCDAWRSADRWSRHRAARLIGKAIFLHEMETNGDEDKAFDFTVWIMHGSR